MCLKFKTVSNYWPQIFILHDSVKKSILNFFKLNFEANQRCGKPALRVVLRGIELIELRSLDCAAWNANNYEMGLLFECQYPFIL